MNEDFIAFLGIVLVLLSVFFIYIRFIEPNLLIKRIVKFNTTKVKKDSKIVLFSDAHFGANYPIKKADRLIKKINNEKPDIVIFAGDMMDNHKNDKIDIEALSQKLRKINSMYGKYSVIGNHEYYNNREEAYKLLMQKSNFHLLINESFNLDILNINIIGVDDYKYGKTNNNFHNYLKRTCYNIYITHEPDFADKINLDNIDLVLSGHTHGGQVYIPILIEKIRPYGARNYLKGLYKNINHSNANLYVTSGVGMSWLPIRFLNIPEIVVFEICKK